MGQQAIVGGSPMYNENGQPIDIYGNIADSLAPPQQSYNLDTVGGTAPLSYLASIGITGDHLAKTGFRDNGDGTATRMSLIEDPTASQQNSSGINGMIGPLITGLAVGGMGAGALGLLGDLGTAGSLADLYGPPISASSAFGPPAYAAGTGSVGQFATGAAAGNGATNMSGFLSDLPQWAGGGSDAALAGDILNGGASAVDTGGLLGGPTTTDWLGNPLSGYTYNLGNSGTGMTDLVNGGSSLSNLVKQVQSIPGGSTALSRILSGNGNSNDYARLLSSGVDLAGALATTNRQNQLWSAGADSRARFQAGQQDPSTVLSRFQPAFDQAASSYLRGMSAKSGNPAGLGNGAAETMKYVYNTSMLPTYGASQGLDLSAGYNPSSTGAASSYANLASALGQGANALTTTTDQNNLTSALKTLKDLGLIGGGGSTTNSSSTLATLGLPGG